MATANIFGSQRLASVRCCESVGRTKHVGQISSPSRAGHRVNGRQGADAGAQHPPGGRSASGEGRTAGKVHGMPVQAGQGAEGGSVVAEDAPQGSHGTLGESKQDREGRAGQAGYQQHRLRAKSVWGQSQAGHALAAAPAYVSAAAPAAAGLRLVVQQQRGVQGPQTAVGGGLRPGHTLAHPAEVQPVQRR